MKGYDILVKKLALFIFALILVAISTSSLAWGENNADRYEKAIDLLSEYKYSEAAKAFAELGDYNDSLRYTMYCNAIAAGEAGNYSIAVENLSALNGFMSSNLATIYYTGLSLESVEEYEQAADILKGLTFYRDVYNRLSGYPDKINNRDYQRADANEQAGNLEEALKAFKKLGSYSDSSERVVSVQEKIYARDYAKADEYEQSNQLENALNGFKALGPYRDSVDRAATVQEKICARDYAIADQAEKDRDYAAAYTGFKALGDYKDSNDRATAVQNKGNYAIALENAKKGNYKEAYIGFTDLGDFEDSADKAYVLSVVNFANLKWVGEYLAAFQMHDLWGIVDFEKNVVTSPYWDDIGTFNENELAMVSLDKKYGYIDRTGKNVIDCKWDDISDFRNGLVTVGKKTISGTLFGLYDAQGTCVTDAVWQTLGSSENSYWGASIKAPMFFENKIKVQAENGLWGFVDTNGNSVGSITWNEIGDFSEGLAAVKKGDLYGYIDSNGEEVIEPQYNDAHAFHEGLAAVKRGGKYQYINKENHVIIQPLYIQVTDFSGGRADVYRAGKGWQVIDQNGHLQYFIDPEMREAYRKAESLMADGQYMEAQDIYKTLNEYEDILYSAEEAEVLTAKAVGFSGEDITVNLTLNENGAIASMNVDAAAETAGLGQLTMEDAFTSQFIGKTGPFALGENVDAVTGATITSNAVVFAVNSLLPAGTAAEAPAADVLTAKAVGFSGEDVTVAITLDDNGAVASMTVDAAAETAGLGQLAMEDAFTSQFVGKTGPFVLGENVDAITGATITSTAVVDAVNSLMSTEAAPDPEADLAAEAEVLTAKAVGFSGEDITVNLTLNENGAIASMNVDANAETPGLGQLTMEYAFISQFIGKTGPFAVGENIDAVTGATISSTAVVEAVNEMIR